MKTIPLLFIRDSFRFSRWLCIRSICFMAFWWEYSDFDHSSTGSKELEVQRKLILIYIYCVLIKYEFFENIQLYIYIYIYMPQFLRKYFWFTDICFKIHVSFFPPSLSRLNFTALPFRQLSCKETCRPHCLPVELCTF